MIKETRDHRIENKGNGCRLTIKHTDDIHVDPNLHGFIYLFISFFFSFSIICTNQFDVMLVKGSVSKYLILHKTLTFFTSWLNTVNMAL